VREQWLRHPLLSERRIEHGFGTRDAVPPAGLRRPRQVHGTRIVDAAACAGPEAPPADGVTSAVSGTSVAVITADCVPILLASADGRAVAAVHAGWRGLASGVVAAGVAALGERVSGTSELVAALGPHIGPCCYEVDGPVIAALAERFSADLAAALTPTRPDHAALDLGRIALSALTAAGLDPNAVGSLPGTCTHCDAERFHSYRRDGPGAGRLVHYITSGSPQA
jgi:YfiH family protein